jgi:hypothetical protein
MRARENFRDALSGTEDRLRRDLAHRVKRLLLGAAHETDRTYCQDRQY